MNEVFAIFAENLILAGILWLGLFLLLAYVFAREALGSFFLGLARTLASIVVSPLIFLKKSVGALAGYGQAGERDFEETDQYLLNKLMIMLQCLLIVGSLGWLAGGLVQAWRELLPPQELRTAIELTETSLEEHKVEAARVSAQVTALETAWAEKKDQLVAAWKQERQKASRAGRTDKNSAQRELVNLPQAAYMFQEVKNYIAGSDSRDADSLSNLRDRMVRWIRNTYYLDEVSQGLLVKYVEGWYTEAEANRALQAFSEDELRQAEQPDYPQIQAQSEELQQTVANEEAQLQAMQEQAKLRFGGAFWALLKSAVSFLFFVWCFGLLIEALWMGIRLAGDVARIRRTVVPRQEGGGPIEVPPPIPYPAQAEAAS